MQHCSWDPTQPEKPKIEFEKHLLSWPQVLAVLKKHMPENTKPAVFDSIRRELKMLESER